METVAQLWITVMCQYLFVYPVVRVCHVSLSCSLLSGDCGHLHEAVGAAYISGSSLRLSLNFLTGAQPLFVLYFFLVVNKHLFASYLVWCPSMCCGLEPVVTVGVIDEKHVRVRAPVRSGSDFHNYKVFFFQLPLWLLLMPTIGLFM